MYPKYKRLHLWNFSVTKLWNPNTHIFFSNTHKVKELRNLCTIDIVFTFMVPNNCKHIEICDKSLRTQFINHVEWWAKLKIKCVKCLGLIKVSFCVGIAYFKRKTSYKKENKTIKNVTNLFWQPWSRDSMWRAYRI